MNALLLYALLSASVWYLLARAMITKWLWSRYPPWLDSFTGCAACSGFWIAGTLALVLGRGLSIAVLDLDPYAWYYAPVVGICGIAWTPLVAYLHQEAMMRLSGTSLLDRRE